MRTWRFTMILVALAAAAAVIPANVAEAGLKDRLKKKLEEKAKEKVGEKTDGVVGEALGEEAETAEGTAEESAAEGVGAAGSGADTKASEVSTKFDFVPGDSVLFADDFTQDEFGEFPARWRLVLGTFEVAEMKGERWLRCVSPDGRIRMKVPPESTLPEFWTPEFDFYGEKPLGSGLTVRALTRTESAAWEATFPQGRDMAFRSGELFSSTPIDEPATAAGRHHVMFMARGTALKAYIDRPRMVNVPDVSLAAGPPVEFEFRLFAPTKPMIANVRFAEECKPAKDLLAEGKLVTYGIRFATGSDVVEPESAPVLRQIATHLQANPTVKLEIVGHTDNTGTAAGNLDLSQRRSGAVARVLSDEFQIAAERFSADGKGSTEAIASNESAEGRARNRRVEFKKL